MSEEQVLTYAIPGNDEGGRLVVYGNKNAEHTIFFCGGFPDDCGAFLPLAKRLAADQSMLCGVTCLPGYDTHHDNFKSTAYTFDEVVASLREATKTLRALSTNPKAKLTGVFHDWGSIFGAILVTRINQEFPHYFADLVFFDILPAAHKSLQLDREKNLKKGIVVLSYTSLFATCHAIQRYLSHYLAAPLLVVGFAVLVLLGLTPTGKLDRDTVHAREPKLPLRKLIYMQYPYFNMYKLLLSGQNLTVASLPPNVQETPVLYMYGIEKKIQFHDVNAMAWLKKKGAKEGSKTKVVPVENAGHWLYIHQEDVCYEAVKKFVLEK